jgi:hypothetical protein
VQLETWELYCKGKKKKKEKEKEKKSEQMQIIDRK